MGASTGDLGLPNRNRDKRIAAHPSTRYQTKRVVPA
jgi:hypothetical protein